MVVGDDCLALIPQIVSTSKQKECSLAGIPENSRKWVARPLAVHELRREYEEGGHGDEQQDGHHREEQEPGGSAHPIQGLVGDGR
jgi:hypothetical protein